jgi:hypothetical protein
MGFCQMCESSKWNSSRGWTPKPVSTTSSYSWYHHSAVIGSVHNAHGPQVARCPEPLTLPFTAFSYNTAFHTDQTTIVGHLEPVAHVDSWTPQVRLCLHRRMCSFGVGRVVSTMPDTRNGAYHEGWSGGDTQRHPGLYLMTGYTQNWEVLYSFRVDWATCAKVTAHQPNTLVMEGSR